LAQIQGFVSFPIDNLYATPLLLEYIKTELIKTSADEVVIVSPDAGGTYSLRCAALHLDMLEL
jgi:ribose-phosphate pyrophosphokinase